MKLIKISKFIAYLSIAMALSVSLFSCQEEETDITNPEPTDILDANSRLVLLINRTVTAEDIDFKIDCLDFEYPISISIFDTDFDIARTDEIESDAQFSSFLETLEEENLIASINYPITTVFVGESTPIEISDNLGLENTLLDGQGTNCNDDPVTVGDCTQVNTTENLKNCKWNISFYSVNEDFESYTFTFNEDATLSLSNNSDMTYTGDWEVFEEDNQLFIKISTQIIDINWQIVECAEDFVQASADTTGTIGLSKDCTTDPVTVQDCTQVNTTENLKNCKWNINRYSINEDFESYTFTFNEDNTLSISNNSDMIYNGDWEVFEQDNQLFIKISTQIIDLNWQIVECGEDFLQASGDNNTIIIAKDCTVEVEDPEITAAKEIVLGCEWLMDRYIVDDQRPFSSLDNTFSFSEDGIFVFENDGVLYRGEWTFEKDAEGNLVLLLDPFQSLPEFIDYDFTIETIRDGFMLWNANTTDNEITTGFEQDCL